MDRSPFSDPPWGVWTDGEDEEAIECRRGEDEDDPWRHLESVESAETQAFVAAQNARSRRVLDRHPWRQRLAETVDRCLTFRRVSCPRLQQDGCYYWLHAGDREARDVIVRSRQVHEHFGRDPSEGGAEPLFDPAWASEQASIYAHSFSPSGKYCCVVLQEAGSDWLSLRTIDASSGKRVEENDPTWSKFTFGVSWISKEAYLYKRAVEVVRAREMGVPDPAFGLFLHRVGSDPELDVNVLPFGSLFTNKPLVCESLPGRPGQHRWLFVDMYKSTNPESEAFLVELKSDEADEVKNSLGSGRKWLSKGFTGLTTCEHEVVIIVTLDYIHADEDIAQDIGSLCDRHLFISTDTCHERGRIVSYSDEAIDAAPVDGLVPMDELVGESSDVIQSAHLAGRSKVLIIVYMRDACSALAFFDAQTGRRLADVTTDVLPESAAISEVSSRPDSDDFYLKVETLISPPYIVVGRVVEGESEMTLARLLAADDEDQKLVCRREFYQSHDGVRVPMFICHAKDLRLEHGLRRPTLLHAYGGYSVSLQPFFDPFFVTFMRELGGVFAMACIRGGGEYGRAWHEAALGARRTVAFDDFVFAARHLQQTLTEPSLTASYGISNGGLLVSACMVRQPDAFGAVISEVGVHDLLRFHRFTLGRLWMGEFGNPDDARDREYLVKLSPLHNVQAGERYPHVLFTTADHDTRVVPSHSLKMLAELQSKAHGRSGRVLGRIYENAGHEAESKSRQQKIDETVDRLIFLLCSLSRSQERGEELKQEERRS